MGVGFFVEDLDIIKIVEIVLVLVLAVVLSELAHNFSLVERLLA